MRNGAQRRVAVSAESAATRKSGSEEELITPGCAASEPSVFSFIRTEGTMLALPWALASAIGTFQHFISWSWMMPISWARSEGLSFCDAPRSVPSEAVRLICCAEEPEDCAFSFDWSRRAMSLALKFLAISASRLALASASLLALAAAASFAFCSASAFAFAAA